MNDNMFFYLNEGCQLVKGAKEGAIYDLIGRDVYSIDGKLVDILINNTGMKIKELVDIGRGKKLEENELKKNLNDLIDLGLAFLSEKKIHIHKMQSFYAKNFLIKTLKDKVKLSSITCEIASKCNLNCIHCQKNEGNILNCFCRKENIKVNDSLNYDEWQNILEIASIAECKKVKLVGGEVLLLERKFERILRFCHYLNFDQIEIITNGTLVDDNTIEMFRELNVSVVIPIYSCLPQFHDSITRVNGSFEKTMNCILKIKNQKVKLSVYLLIMNQNKDTLEETLNYFKKLKINCQVGIIRSLDLDKSNTTLDGLKNSLFKHHPFFPQIDLESFNKRKLGNRCWLYSLAIKHNGDVLPCIGARKFIIDNVRKTPLNKLLINDVFEKYWFLSLDKIKICKNCEYKYTCEDCRILGMAYGGDLYSKDPSCRYDPFTAQWEKKKHFQNR